MSEVGWAQLKEVLNKNWMTHDGMWFYHCMHECGIEKTNRINKAAVKSMALIEVVRLMALFRTESVTTFDQFREFVDMSYEIVKADFMKFDYSFHLENVFRMEMKQCHAYKGINKMGAIEQYDCGVFERINGWLEGLGIGYQVNPPINGCMMHTDGHCFREYKLDLPG